MVQVNQTTINKFLAKRLGVEWHELDYIRPASGFDFERFYCKCGQSECYKETIGFHFNKSNPKYFTASGRQVLLEWCVDQDWWNSEDGFIDSLGDVEPFINSSGTTAGISLFIDHMLIPVTRFTREVYLYLEGIDDAR